MIPGDAAYEVVGLGSFSIEVRKLGSGATLYWIVLDDLPPIILLM
jgi:hypothetical protein